MNITNDLIFKVIVVGQAGCGKTCLIERYVKQRFSENYQLTIGAEFYSKTITVDGIALKIQIWDTAGQQTFHSLTKSFYRSSNAVLIVFDITRRSSFNKIDVWHQQALQNSPTQTIYVLIGTHSDLEDQREVLRKEAEEWIRDLGVQMYFETSAKTSQNVEMAFEEICRQILLRRVTQNKQSPKVSIEREIQQKNKQKCC